MNNYYSKHKKDQVEELAKIEQKRYEDMMAKERSNKKIVASSIGSLLEKSQNKDFKLDPNSKISRKRSQIPETDKPRDRMSSEPPIKSSTPVYQSRSNSETNSIPESIVKLPSIKKKNNNANKELSKSELDILDQEEAIIQSSIQRLDLQVYKKKIQAHLQTIDEETKEIEESIARGSNGISTQITKELVFKKELQKSMDFSERKKGIIYNKKESNLRDYLQKVSENPSIVSDNAKSLLKQLQNALKVLIKELL